MYQINNKLYVFFFLNKKEETCYINISILQHHWGCQLARLSRKPRQLDTPCHMSLSVLTESGLRV